ncbi:MAG TPA: Ppx/GppA phosphatase family protein [Geminicoccus sp.]|jgi:exopolyphosphatase/guanosine-5'-triphosphate,3'-diphosphate pyrophosphatase|uniref:Ppx/GppA phosphatase family protein n=1 Tax=Geminicoccus sp. TaxID=2024832 RepID=UPI002E342AD5|nr:Ppx/GppA phosphatase family protein [Geminicoccus sp.]HEX2525533.1 Ppx/GppA phosphatase family protein [Geminicoccus sp.]
MLAEDDQEQIDTREPPAERAPVLAALDLGTNNCRLLVAREQSGGFEVVDSFSRIVRLGEGLAYTGRLSDRAMARTIAALRVCRSIMVRRGVTKARCVATEACRRAENGPAFVERVFRLTGIRLEVLDQEEEASLALLGCLPLVDLAARHLVMIDIGGGSTEVMWLDRSRAAEDGGTISLSLPLGVVTLSESFGSEPDAERYDRMVAFVAHRLTGYEQMQHIANRSTDGTTQVLGTSGTVTTMAAIHLGLRRYDRRRVDGTMLEYGVLDAVGRHLRTLTNAERAAHPCIGKGRADLVVAGCAILDAVCRIWPIERLHVADRGVREGILNGLIGKDLHQLRAPFGAFV